MELSDSRGFREFKFGIGIQLHLQSLLSVIHYISNLTGSGFRAAVQY
jgi:hypothetical protein